MFLGAASHIIDATQMPTISTTEFISPPNTPLAWGIAQKPFLQGIAGSRCPAYAEESTPEPSSSPKSIHVTTIQLPSDYSLLVPIAQKWVFPQGVATHRPEDWGVLPVSTIYHRINGATEQKCLNVCPHMRPPPSIT